MVTVATLDIAPTLVPAAETVIIGPVPASHEFTLPVIRFVNTDTVDRTLTIWNKTSGAAGTDDDVEQKDYTIAPKAVLEHGPLILAPGRRISVAADVAGKISVRPHGWDFGP